MKATGSRRLTLLHTADIHLDNLPIDSAQSPMAYRSFEAIIDCARDVDVDLVLIAGDLFDHNRVKTKRPWSLPKISCDAGLPGLLFLPGNHDCLQADGIYRRHDFSAACNNVRVISDPAGESITFPNWA